MMADMSTLNPTARHPRFYLAHHEHWREGNWIAAVEEEPLTTYTHTAVSLPWIDDAVVVAVEEGGVLLQHAHVVVVAVIVRRPLRVVDVRSRQSSRQICSAKW
jgi:hypothetical protein